MNDGQVLAREWAHDLNNQLMILMNALDRLMVLHPNEPEPRTAVKAAEHCAALAAQLAPKRRLPPGADPAPSARDIINEAALLVRQILPSGNRLETECHCDLRIPINASDLRHLLVSLCLIAIESTQSSGIIRLFATSEPAIVSFCVQFNDSDTASRADLARIESRAERLGGSFYIETLFPRGICARIDFPLQ